ncbi:MAG: ABC transporter permease [bacterium]
MKKLRKPGTFRFVSFVLFIAISICPATFVVSAIEATRKSILHEFGDMKWEQFDVEDAYEYKHLKALKIQNDNIDYAFSVSPYIMYYPFYDEDRGKIRYHELPTCAMSVDDFLLGSKKKQYLLEGRNLTAEDHEKRAASAIIAADFNDIADYKDRKVGDKLKICSQPKDFLCVEHRIVGKFKDLENAACSVIIPKSSVSNFQEGSYWLAWDEQTYFGVKELLYLKSTVEEIIHYLMRVSDDYTKLYNVKANQYEKMVRTMTRLSRLSIAVFILLLFVVAFGIVNFIVLTVWERKKDIAVALVAGYTKEKVALIFALRYFLICVPGLVLGFVLSAALTQTALRNILMEQFSHFDPSYDAFAAVSVVSLVACFFVCFISVWTVASRPPAELLREN